MKYLPAGMKNLLQRLDPDAGQILLLRHSLREQPENLSPSFEVPLTRAGTLLAKQVGQCFRDKPIQALSSTSPRCIATATAVLEGAVQSSAIATLPILKEPGCYALPIKESGLAFRELGPLGFVNGVLSGDVSGSLPAQERTMFMLGQLQGAQGVGGITLAVTHDTILATVVAVLQGKQELIEGEWPAMMEGVLLQSHEKGFKWWWREGAGNWSGPANISDL